MLMKALGGQAGSAHLTPIIYRPIIAFTDAVGQVCTARRPVVAAAPPMLLPVEVAPSLHVSWCFWPCGSVSCSPGSCRTYGPCRNRRRAAGFRMTHHGGEHKDPDHRDSLWLAAAGRDVGGRAGLGRAAGGCRRGGAHPGAAPAARLRGHLRAGGVPARGVRRLQVRPCCTPGATLAKAVPAVGAFASWKLGWRLLQGPTRC